MGSTPGEALGGMLAAGPPLHEGAYDGWCPSAWQVVAAHKQCKLPKSKCILSIPPSVQRQQCMRTHHMALGLW